MSNDTEGMTPEQQREAKNSVFAAAQQMQGGLGMVSQLDTARKELDYEIPVETVPLPSRGLIYPVGSPLYRQEFVDIKAMTSHEEDILMSRALIKKGTVITELIKSCLINPNIMVGDLISGDRNALMVSIRITGYGSEYTPQVQCPSCELKQDYSINLTDLELKMLTLEPVQPGVNRFSFTLPVSKKDVEFKFLTGREEEEIVATAENKKKQGMVNDNVITTRLKYSLISVNGDMDRNKIAKFVQYMPAKDSLALRKYIDKHEPGVDMKYNFKCKSCDHDEMAALPLGITFFWPSNS